MTSPVPLLKELFPGAKGTWVWHDEDVPHVVTYAEEFDGDYYSAADELDWSALVALARRSGHYPWLVRRLDVFGRGLIDRVGKAISGRWA